MLYMIRLSGLERFSMGEPVPFSNSSEAESVSRLRRAERAVWRTALLVLLACFAVLALLLLFPAANLWWLLQAVAVVGGAVIGVMHVRTWRIANQRLSSNSSDVQGGGEGREGREGN